MNEVRFPHLLRVVGIVALLHASIGVLIGLGVMFIVPKIDPARFNERDFAQMLKDMPEDAHQNASQVDVSEITKIMSSKEFRLFFYIMTSFGLVFNAALAFLGYLFICLRSKRIWLFVALMLIFAVYSHGLPAIACNSALAGPFSAAWGIGNMGLGLMLLSYFWLWGPVLALIARGKVPKKI